MASRRGSVPRGKDRTGKRNQLDHSRGHRPPTISMTSTEAQNGFGHLLETVAADRTVIITSRNAPRAVVMSVDRYRELSQETTPDLDALTADFDAMLERMQLEDSRTGLQQAFRASPDELASAAVAAAREKRG